MKVSMWLLAAAGASSIAVAQPPASQSSEGTAMHEAMSGAMHAGRHLELTPVRPGTAADSLRAAAVVDSLRRSIAQFADTMVAVAAGYRMFLPNVKNQRVYHFTHWRRAMGEAFRFDPGKPTSLLYRRGDGRTLVLIGAMYGAPRRFGHNELNARVPLSMARWHRHINLCLPRKGDEHRWTERDSSGAMLFGSEGTIATAEECTRAGGRFLPALAGWMVHVNAMEKNPWGEAGHKH